MATPAAVLSVLLEANTSSANRALARYHEQLQTVNEHTGVVEKSTGRMNKSIESTKKPAESATKSMSGFAKSVLAAGGAFAAFEAAKNAIESTVELGHSVERLSAVTGLDTKTASTWIESMKVRGVQTKAVGMAFITLSKNIRNSQEAGDKQGTAVKALIAQQKIQTATLEATGASHQKLTLLEQKQQLALDAMTSKTATAQKAFKELGVTQKDLASGNTQQVLLDVADGLEKIKNPADRAALAQQLFGRGAQALIPVLKEGRKGVEDMLDATQKYGAFLPNTTKATAGAVEAQRNLALAADGLKISFTEAVLPTLVKVGQGLLGFITQMRDGKGAGGQFAQAIGQAFGVIKSVVGGVVSTLGGLKNTLLILGGLWATSKVVAFGKALQGLAGTAGPVAAGVEKQASAGILSGLRAGVVRGLAIGGIGSLLSAGIGDAVKGSTGDAIKKIGTDASIGAGIGSAFGPAGIAGGALIGGLVGSVSAFITSHAADQGKQWAAAFTAPLPDAIQKATTAHLAAAKTKISDTQFQKRLDASAPGFTPGSVNPRAQAQAQRDQAKIVQQFYAFGIAAGNATVRGLQSVRDTSPSILLSDFLMQLNKLPAQAQPAAAKTMLDFAIGLEQSGKIPYKSLQTIIQGLEKQIPGFEAYLQNQGQVINQVFSKTLLLGPATQTLKDTLAGYRKQFGDWAISTHLTANNIYQSIAAAMDHLHQTVATSSGQTRKDAISELSKLHDQTIQLFDNMAGKVNTSIKNMSDAIKGGSESAARVAAVNLGSFADNVKSAMNNGVISAGQGMKLIVDETNKALKEMGQKTLTPIQVGVTMLSIGKQQQLVGHATGGMVNQPGYFAGEEAPRHPEVILATNPAYRSRNLGLFAQAGHMLGVPGFAAGGITAPSVTGGGSTGTVVRGAVAKVTAAANAFLGARIATAGPSGGPPSAGHVSGSVASWIAQAMALTGVGGPLWTAMLYRQVMRESSGNPLSINLTDSNAAAGHPSKGLLQTIDGTFNQYALPGHGNIWNPVDNAAAAIRYMIANYGHGNSATAAAVMWGRGGGGYRKGGVHGRIPHFATGGKFTQTGATRGGSLGASFTTVPQTRPTSIAASSVNQLIGLPPLPHVGGATPTTIAGAQDLAGTISGLRQRVSGLLSDYGTLDQYFNLNPPVLTDPVTGELNHNEINRRIAQLNRLIAIRQQIFELWGRIVVYTQRLVEANRNIIDGLQKKLAGIKTKGLKGKALTAAQALQTSTRSSITKYQGNLTSAISNLTSDTNSRTSSWLDVLDVRGQRAGVLATAGPVAAAAIDTSVATTPTVDNSAQLALLQTLLTQSQQTTAVAEAQYGVLQQWQQSMPPFGGSFQSGGVVPGPAGSPRTIIAHGGESVGQAPIVNVTFGPGMDWLRQFMRVELDQATRPLTRQASRNLPGSR